MEARVLSSASLSSFFVRSGSQIEEGGSLAENSNVQYASKRYVARAALEKIA